MPCFRDVPIGFDAVRAVRGESFRELGGRARAGQDCTS